MKLDRRIVEKPWGCTGLSPQFCDSQDRRTGELWFDHPQEKLPLLVKWLFTSEPLSIQVHPDDAIAARNGLPSGKEESWLVVSAQEGARIGVGLKASISASELRDAIQGKRVADLVDWRPVKAGDYFHVPAGTIHSIGGGITLVEIQQNADITYRLHDFSRSRELHIEHALEAASRERYDSDLAGSIDASVSDQVLIDCHHYSVRYARGKAIESLVQDAELSWIIPIQGSAQIKGEEVGVGETAYVDRTTPVNAPADFHALVATCVDAPAERNLAAVSA